MADCCVCGKYTHMVAAKWYCDTFVKIPICIRCEITLPQNSIDKILDSMYNAGTLKKENAYVLE